MVKKRFEHIDFLRAVSIIGVIAIHTLSFNLTNQLNYIFWNYLNFVVVPFVFCSGYVLVAHYMNRLDTREQILKWYKKRLVHLLTPYYVYLLIYYALCFALPDYFFGLGLRKSSDFLLSSIFLTGGADLNWLTLLFLQLTVLFPILMNLQQRKSLLSKVYIGFAMIITVYFTVVRFPYTYYRYVLWIPWSLILVAAMVIFPKEHNDRNVSQTTSRYIRIGGISLVLFLVLMLVHALLRQSFQLVDYKYPPDLYYLSYGLLITCVLMIPALKLHIHSHPVITAWSMYISKHSYALFFIHYIVLDLTLKLTKNVSIWSHPFLQFILVLSFSLLIASMIERVNKKIPS